MVFMNFWYIKHYCARVGDDFVTKNNKLEVSRINRRIDAKLL